MFFSVIVPTYNRRSLLAIAVDSILNQTDKDYELIIIDDGSDDLSYEELSQMKPQIPNMKLLRQNNRGVAAARNAGIRAAESEWLCFLDSDDRFRQEKLALTRQYIDLFPLIRVFHSNELWYRNGGFMPQKKIHAKLDGEAFFNSLAVCRISPSTVCVHRSVFNETGLFDESFPVCEDYELWLRITLRYPIKLIPEALTIKEGGREDQLSASVSLDKFRTLALEKLLNNNSLKHEQRRAVEQELFRKRNIYLSGYHKREKQIKQ